MQSEKEKTEHMQEIITLQQTQNELLLGISDKLDNTEYTITILDN